MITMKEDLFLKSLLNREVMPATGCTEIGAVALAAGWAVRALDPRGGEIDRMEIEVDQNTYKNALGVGVPGTGETGLGFAAAMGVFLSARAEQGLQILENPDEKAIRNGRSLLQENRVQIKQIPEARDIWIKATVSKGQDQAAAIIQGSHDHLVGVERNGKPFSGAPVFDETSWKTAEQIKALPYRSLIDFVQGMDPGAFPILKQAITMNVAFAEEARKNLSSMKIGQVIERSKGMGGREEDLSRKIQFLTAQAVEARMGGLDLPVMACAGSGNQGLVATLPVVEIGKRVGASEQQVLRALALSFLTTIYVKTFTGLLSPICGCGVAAAVGAGCGIVYLMGGKAPQIEAQISNMIGTMAGIICDGAKSGCSMKALMAVGLAIDSSYLSMENVQIPAKDGIMGVDVLDTLKNLQKIIEGGMSSMDSTIVEVMEAKKTKP
jgi:L-cysteine desulfidase